MSNYLIHLSTNLLKESKLGNDSTILRRELYFLKPIKLYSSLNTDDLKKAFWINIYNAYVLILLSEGFNSKSAFSFKRIKICKQILSLDDIEHKILRMGDFNGIYLLINKLFLSDFIKHTALQNVDFSLRNSLLKDRFINSEQIL